jgi:hypothetical protein
MRSQTSRIEKLEQVSTDQTALLVEEIVIHRTYEDREEEVEYIKVTHRDEFGWEVASAYLPKNGREDDLPETDPAGAAGEIDPTTPNGDPS